MKKGELYGNCLALIVTIIYGLNTPVMKSILPEWIDALALTTVRLAFTALLFWVSSLFINRSKIPMKHIFYFALGGLTGLALNQIPYAMGLTLGSPVDSSILRSFTPIVVIILSVIFFKKQLSFRLVFSIFLGVMGAVLIIIFGGNGKVDGSNLLSSTLVLVSVISYSIYLVAIKPLVMLYHPIHIMKWMFLFATLFTLPFSYEHVIEAKAFTMETNWDITLRLAYIVFAATYIGYLLNLSALKYISATKESTFSYIQPVVATIVAILLGQDKLSWVDPLSLLLIFISFFLLNHHKKELNPQGQTEQVPSDKK